MLSQGFLSLIAKSYVFQRVAQYLGGAVIGLSALAWIMDAAGPPGRVSVHVTEPDVEVSVGGEVFSIEERRFDPIVCDLPTGSYELVMTRGDRELYRESFRIRNRETIVLTAYDPERLGAGSDPGEGGRGPIPEHR